MKTLLPLVCGLALAAAAATALSQAPVYKLRQGEGGTVYSDQPKPGAQPRPDLGDTKTNVVAPIATPEQVTKYNEQLNERIARRDALWDKQLKALVALNTAKDAQKLGEEPLPGERRGTVSRKSRLTEEYWARQAALQADVDRAQAELDGVRDELRQLGN